MIGFHADSVNGLRDAFHEAVDDYLAMCERIGKRADKAYSGELMLRVDPQVHSMAATAADLAGMSMNA